MECFRLQVRSDSGQLEVVLAWLESLYNPSIPWSVWLEVQTAIGEGFDNAVRHAHKDLPASTPVAMALELGEGLVVVKIWDYGPGFDFEQLMQRLPEQVSPDAVSGRGFCILRRVADRLEYRMEPDRRNCLHLEKNFAPVGQPWADMATREKPRDILGGTLLFEAGS